MNEEIRPFGSENGGVGGWVWLLLKLKCSGSDRIAFLQLDELGFGVWGSEKEPGSFFLLSSRPEGLLV